MFIIAKNRRKHYAYGDFFESLGSFGNFIYLLKGPDPSLP